MTRESRSLDFIGYPNYRIFSDGVLVNESGRKIRPFINKKGYHQVILQLNHRKKTTHIHVLVAMAFVDNPNSYETVDHIDNDPSNNDASNLQWLPNEDNAKKSWEEGNHDHQKKTVLQLSEDGQILNEFESIQEAADFVSIDRSCISRACSKGSKSKGYYWRFSTIQGQNTVITDK